MTNSQWPQISFSLLSSERTRLNTPAKARREEKKEKKLAKHSRRKAERH